MGNNYEYSKGYCEGYVDGHRKAQGQSNPVNYSDCSYYYNNMQKTELEEESDSSLGAKIRKIAEGFAQEPTAVDSVSDRLFKSMKEEILSFLLAYVKKTNERIRLLEDIIRATPVTRQENIEDTAHNTLEQNESKDSPAEFEKIITLKENGDGTKSDWIKNEKKSAEMLSFLEYEME